MKSRRLLDDLTILSLFYVALGAVLLGWPEVSSQIICCAFGAVLAVAGAVRIVRYFIKDKLDGLIRRDLAVGLSLVIAGVFLLVRPDSVLSLLPLLFGLLLLGGGASKLQTAVDLRRIDSSYWVYALIMALVTAGLGAALLCQPFSDPLTATRFIGVSILVEGAENLAAFSVFRRKLQDYYAGRL